MKQSLLHSLQRNLLTLSCFIVSAGSLISAEERIIFHDDFETPTDQSPPPGWTMWGDEKYKDHTNYTRDTTQSFGGQASFRIHHPDRTKGYIISSPESAIETKMNRIYTVSFRAKTAQTGDASFSWLAYKRIHPYVDAPSPGSYPLSLTPDWKEFHFVLREGWDFFTDDSPLLMLTFRPSAKEQTLWIDDVTVTEQISDQKDRLISPATLSYEPLNHRLKPGNQFQAVIHADRILRSTHPEVGGVSFHRVSGWSRLPFDRDGEYVLPSVMENTIRQLHLPMTRFYALGSEHYGLEEALDKAAGFLEKIGIPQTTSVLELEIQNATSVLSPEDWRKGVRHSQEKGYGFHFWEISNEPWVERSESAFPTADSYLEHFLSVSRAIRSEQSDARIGLSIHHSRTPWNQYLIKQAAGHYDFVVPHYYVSPDVNRGNFEDAVLTANYQICDLILRNKELLRLHNSGRDVYQYDTEWGLHSSGPAGERADYVRRNANIWGTMHRAVRLICYLREDLLRGASSWEMFSQINSPGFGFLAADAPEMRSMFYWLYYYFNRHVGHSVLAIDGTAPFYEGKINDQPFRGPLTPMVATLSEDAQQIYVILANASWDRSVPIELTLEHFPAKRAIGVTLSDSDLDGSPFVTKREDLVTDWIPEIRDQKLTTTLAPHSVVFLTITR